MTIQRAIELLTELKIKHGDVEVNFDCPYCNKTTKPDQIVPVVTLEKWKS